MATVLISPLCVHRRFPVSRPRCSAGAGCCRHQRRSRSHTSRQRAVRLLPGRRGMLKLVKIGTLRLHWSRNGFHYFNICLNVTFVCYSFEMLFSSLLFTLCRPSDALSARVCPCVSQPFDLACGSWASTLSPAPLLQTATALVDRALSCGFTGLVMLHGLLTEAGGPSTWQPALWALGHPTYYGMMVASFLPAAK